ncbi:MAG: Trk system potassium transporter TrkA [Clostridia bacterium]|nr:Trk system potassium transporter TrkA [Clostridia bacterium]
MKILVAGCGKIGTTILSSLTAEGHDVTALDSDPAVIAEITNIYDTMGMVGNAADCETLAEAGVDAADVFIAVTGSDEQNMLSCFLARRMGARHTVARIRNPEYNDNSLGFMCRELNLSLAINPEKLAAHELYNMLKLPSALKVETFSGQNMEMIEVRLKQDSPLDGMRLSDMRVKYNRAKFLVCFVQREEEVFIPDGNFELKSGDKIGMTAAPAEFQKLLRDLGLTQKQARSVMLLGGSRTAYYLAKHLTDTGNDVKIIERDEAHCETLSDLLPRAVILHGDGTNQELLMEEGLASTDAFVSLTGMDEQNILISIFAAAQNVPKVITKINRAELEDMADKLGLDSVIAPRRTVSDRLVSYVRALSNSRGSHIETLYRLADDKAEALEFTVSPDARCIGIPLRQLQMKPGILIAGIIRRHTPIIPTGNDSILSGDRVIVISAKERLQDLSDIMRD